MRLAPICLAACAALAMTTPQFAHAQSFPGLPGVKKPKLPNVLRSVKGSQNPASTVMPSLGNTGGDDTEAYTQDVMIVAQGINIMGNDASNDERIDAEIETYLAAVNRIAANQRSGVEPMMRSSMQRQMRQYFDQRTQRVDADINFLKERVSANAGYDQRISTRTFNGLAALRAELDAALILFPGSTDYEKAKSKVEAFASGFTSREASNDALGAIGEAEAAKVQMPAATKNDPALERMFRSAFASGGMTGEILKVNPRGGWEVKRNDHGRVIGETHSAAIAARNPKIAGTCNLYTFTLLKETNGAVRRNSHTTQRIACANVK